jgi:hypothetical protein
MDKAISGALKCSLHDHPHCINKDKFLSIQKRIVGQIKSLLKRYVENSEDSGINE